MKRAIVHGILHIALLLAVLAAAAPVHAWNSFGHMEVAYLAYQKLTPATKARVWTLLQLNPDFPTWESTIPAGTTDADKQLMVFMMAAWLRAASGARLDFVFLHVAHPERCTR